MLFRSWWLRRPLKLALLLLPGRWGRAERLLWRHLSFRQRCDLYLCHRILVHGHMETGATRFGRSRARVPTQWRLSRAWWRPASCVHYHQRGMWWWRPWCYGGPGGWMPRADVLLSMKLLTEARGSPLDGGGPL